MSYSDPPSSKDLLPSVGCRSTCLSCPWLQRAISHKQQPATEAEQGGHKDPSILALSRTPGQAMLTPQFPAGLAKALFHLHHSLSFPAAQSFFLSQELFLNKYLRPPTSISMSDSKELNSDRYSLCPLSHITHYNKINRRKTSARGNHTRKILTKSL